MIFEGTKNKFFFGLGLTRAGKTLPDISLFRSICEELGINITELLNGKRTDKEADLKELFGLLIDFFDQENKRIIRFVKRY